VSDLNDPRVLFAAERTSLAWSRTAAGLMALGFFIDRASLMGVAAEPDRKFAVWIGIAFLLLLGVLLGILSVVQYRRSVASLRPVEIPLRYWPNLAVLTSLAVSVLGLLLALYLLKTL
jgi:putative membrane protein